MSDSDETGPTALLLFSGGQDSATALGWALERFPRVDTVGFTYGQRHVVEMEARAAVRHAVAATFPVWGARLGEDRVLDAGVLAELGGSTLTGEGAIEAPEDALPNTFVPGRNLLFLTLAAALAWQRSIGHLVAGVCETDDSGYPDCRDDTVKAMQVALNLGMDSRFVLHTPLMWLDKAQTWRLAERTGGEAWVEVVRTRTHTCYEGTRDTLHAWGYGCGRCPACRLRASGWRRYRHGPGA